MTPHQSHLKSDGTVFPPVTPDPPLPPGQADIEVPDIVPVRAPEGPKSTASTQGSTTPDTDEGSTGEAPQDAAPAGA